MSLILLLITIGAIFAVIREEMLTRQLARIILIVGSPVIALSLQPELLVGLRRGVDEFKQAVRDLFG